MATVGVERLTFCYPRDAMHKRGICCRMLSVRPSVRPSVCLSVCHDLVLYQNGLLYRQNYFTAWQPRHSSFDTNRRDITTGSPPTGALNIGGIEINQSINFFFE